MVEVYVIVVSWAPNGVHLNMRAAGLRARECTMASHGLPECTMASHGL